MSWPRFLAFNAAGGIVWATVIGLAYYYIGNTVKNVRGPFDIVLGIIAAIVIIGFLIYLRRTEKRYAARAEHEFPGPLDD